MCATQRRSVIRPTSRRRRAGQPLIGAEILEPRCLLSVVGSQIDPIVPQPLTVSGLDGNGVSDRVDPVLLGSMPPPPVPSTGLAIGSLTIVPNFDNSVTSNPDRAQIESAFNYAAAEIEGDFSPSVPTTVNITVSADSSVDLGEAAPRYWTTPYFNIKNAIVGQVPGVNLPSSDPLGGQYPCWVSTAQAKALGLTGPSGASDGTFTFNPNLQYTFDPQQRAVPGQNDFIAVCEHEITHILGRVSLLGDPNGPPNAYTLFDLFRFTSSGIRTYSPGPAYFSIDNGATPLRAFDVPTRTKGDPADWDSAEVDAFDASLSPGQRADLSAADIASLYVLGYHQLGALTVGRAIAVQVDGKLVVAGSAVSANGVQGFELRRYDADGTLDTSFGPSQSGEVITDFFGVADSAYALAIQPDGKIVVGGAATQVGGNVDFALARYNPNGTLDTGFGPAQTGLVTTDFYGNTDDITGLAIQPDGKIVAEGTTVISGSDSAFALARYNSDGALDTSFGPARTGLITTSFGGEYMEAWALALQPDGKVVVAGNTGVSPDQPSTFNFALARYNPDGSLDTSFGPSRTGTVSTDLLNYYDSARAVAIQPNGDIVVAGIAGLSAAGGNVDTALVRYLPNGTVDTSFGGIAAPGSPYVGKGLTYINIGGGQNDAFAVALQSDGKIVTAGRYTDSNANFGFAITRFDANGAPDNAFGNSGTQVSDFAGGNGEAYGVAVESDGSIVAAGYDTAAAQRMDFAVARYSGVNGLPLGAPDGSNGGGTNNGGGTPSAGLSAPTGVLATATSSTTVTLTWQAVSGSASYNVLRLAPGDTVFKQIATGLTATSFPDTGLTTGGAYQYEVQAVNTSGSSPDSAPVNIMVANADLGSIARGQRRVRAALDPTSQRQLIYAFTLTNPLQRVIIQLGGLKANADLELLDASDKEIAGSHHPRHQNEAITNKLPAGTYYIGAYLVDSAATPFALNLRVTPLRVPKPKAASSAKWSLKAALAGAADVLLKRKSEPKIRGSDMAG